MAEPLPVIEHKPQVPGVPLRAPPQRLPGSKEIATLRVRNELFTNWTSVRVEQRVTEAFPTFQFECTEESPMPLKPWMLAFVPGDVVQVYVGGAPAVYGYIIERHVGYDGTNHGVRLIGSGDTIDLTNSTVPVEKIKNYSNKSWTEIFHILTEHLGTKLTTKNIDNTPYADVQVLPGETIMTALERYARPRNIVIGSVASGGLLALGEHQGVSTGKLQESVNILRANCVVRDHRVYKRYVVIAQGKGSDSAHGAGQNQQKAELGGTSRRNRQWVIPMEVADTMHGVQRRVKMEHVFCEGSYIEAQITVQGWFKDSNQSDEVWRAGEYYSVYSPSLMMHGEILGCQSCVYEQNAQGTTTTLTMVLPEWMNGFFNVRNVEDIVQQQKQRSSSSGQSGPGIVGSR
jgi:prophage tail gpP-like protein